MKHALEASVMVAIARPSALLLAALIIASAPAMPAQERLSEEIQAEVTTLQGRADLFFRQFSDKTIGPERAVREIVGSGPLKDRNEEISRLIDQALTLDQRYGVYTGHDAVGVRTVGSDLIFLRYLYKGERFPVVWYFAFYRTAIANGIKRDWSLISLRFDTKIEALER
jgi:hypothetical protein